MMDAQLTAKKLAQTAKKGFSAPLNRARQLFMGRWAVCKAGRYAGRRGRIRGIIVEENAGLRFCVMVERVDGTGPLNNEYSDSRTYWSIDQIKIEDQ